MSGAKAEVCIALVGLLATFAQKKLPYRLHGVESNDVLYAGDAAYTAELADLTHNVFQVRTAMLGCCCCSVWP